VEAVYQPRKKPADEQMTENPEGGLNAEGGATNPMRSLRRCRELRGTGQRHERRTRFGGSTGWVLKTPKEDGFAALAVLMRGRLRHSLR